MIKNTAQPQAISSTTTTGSDRTCVRVIVWSGFGRGETARSLVPDYSAEPAHQHNPEEEEAENQIHGDVRLDRPLPELHRRSGHDAAPHGPGHQRVWDGPETHEDHELLDRESGPWEESVSLGILVLGVVALLAVLGFGEVAVRRRFGGLARCHICKA